MTFGQLRGYVGGEFAFRIYKAQGSWVAGSLCLGGGRGQLGHPHGIGRQLWVHVTGIGYWLLCCL